MSSEKAWCAVRIPIHPKDVQWDRGQASQILPHTHPWKTMPFWMSLCALGLCHNKNVGPLVPVNCSATVYKKILYKCALPTLGQEFGEEPHMEEMVRCF